MSFRRRHRWNRRILLGLAFGVMAVVAVPAQARPYESASVQGEAVKTQHATQPPLVISYLSHGMTAADVQASVPPDAIERYVAANSVETSVPPDAIERFVAASTVDPLSGIPLSAGIPQAGDAFVVLDTTTGAVIPNDRPNPRPLGDQRPVVVASDGDGFTFDLQNGLTVGAAALLLAAAFGLGLAYSRRPRIAV